MMRPPEYVGYWQVGGQYGLRLMMERRPTWLQRRMCRWLFGINWHDGAPK